MTITEALQQNKMAFSLMCTDEFTNEEMQAKVREIGSEYFELLEIGGWKRIALSYAFSPYLTYRLRADYTEDETGYETVPIHLLYDNYHYVRDGSSWLLETAIHHPNFAGYLYEDGKIRSTPVIYKIGTTGWYEIEESKFNEYEILRPTHVVFKKGNNDASAT